MDAVRCQECGDVRWSLFGFTEIPTECEVCGGEMAAERRRPDITAHRLREERRGLVTHAEPAQTASHLSA
jgi:hypothetical protein